MAAKILWVALGGSLGSVLRYLAGVAVLRALPTLSFPLATLLVNVLGCFLIGLVHQLAMQTTRVPPDLRLFLTTGILGGFTTYSSFNYEVTELAREGAWGSSALYLAATVGGGIGAGLAGIACAGWLATRLLGACRPKPNRDNSDEAAGFGRLRCRLRDHEIRRCKKRPTLVESPAVEEPGAGLPRNFDFRRTRVGLCSFLQAGLRLRIFTTRKGRNDDEGQTKKSLAPRQAAHSGLCRAHDRSHVRLRGR